ncbi:MAG: Crp/Fnr family transcriptional regulator [Kiloniellales bacterium]|nr:Crp/Fnr family transcriptional regulator [Kiloniellales bacterium]
MSATPEVLEEQFRRRTGLTARDQEILAGVPLFSGLAVDGIQALLADAWAQPFERNTVLFLQDDPGSRFYVILDGWVKLFRTTEEGEESVIAVFGRGESFAEAAMFDAGIYPVGAATVEESRLLVVPAAPFVRQLTEHGEYVVPILAAMSRHLRRLVNQVEQLTLKSSTERVAGFLIKLCPADANDANVRLPLDKALIAGRLGMQPETFSRSLAKLRKVGVESHGAEICIPDVAALREVSNGHAPCAPGMRR